MLSLESRTVWQQGVGNYYMGVESSEHVRYGVTRAYIQRAVWG